MDCQGERDEEFISLHRLLLRIHLEDSCVQGIRDSKWAAHTVCPPLIKGQQESCTQRSVGTRSEREQLEGMPWGGVLKVFRKK